MVMDPDHPGYSDEGFRNPAWDADALRGAGGGRVDPERPTVGGAKVEASETWLVTDRDWMPGYRIQATIGTDARGDIAQVVSVEDADRLVRCANAYPRLLSTLMRLCAGKPTGHDWMRAHRLLEELGC